MQDNQDDRDPRPPAANTGDADLAGQNARPLNDTIAGTGPGIPDDALSPGETDLPVPPSDDAVRRAAKALHAPVTERQE